MLNIDYFNKIKKINKIFSDIDFTKNLVIKDKKFTKNKIIKLVFIRKNNSEDKYSVLIYNDWNIKVTIPIKNSNYKYTSSFDNIESVYIYLHLHI